MIGLSRTPISHLHAQRAASAILSWRRQISFDTRANVRIGRLAAARRARRRFQNVLRYGEFLHSQTT
jgi:hypothetical protein